jgi:hypothetical protein
MYYDLYEFSHVLLALWWCLPVCVPAAVVLQCLPVCVPATVVLQCLPVCVPATVVLHSVRHKLSAALFHHLTENPQQKWFSYSTIPEQIIQYLNKTLAQSDVFRWSLSTHKTRMLFTTSGLRSSEMLCCDVWLVVPSMSPSSSDIQWFNVHED